MTHRSGNEEARKQVPEVEEERHCDGSDLMAGSERDNHHAVHREVGIAHEYEVVEVQDLAELPLKTDHRVENEGINNCLNRHIDCFDSHLIHKAHQSTTEQENTILMK